MGPHDTSRDRQGAGPAQPWLNDGRLSYTYAGPEMISTWYDSTLDTTYFGVVPEPGAVSLLLGLGALLLRRRRA